MGKQKLAGQITTLHTARSAVGVKREVRVRQKKVVRFCYFLLLVLFMCLIYEERKRGDKNSGGCAVHLFKKRKREVERSAKTPHRSSADAGHSGFPRKKKKKADLKKHKALS